jgi:YegS C-terminal NAD kinase beta sandwich-like domain
VTVRRGGPWGEAGDAPAGLVVVTDDAGARRVVEEARRAGGPVPALGLAGGDLCRTLGGRGDRSRLAPGADGTRALVDLGSVLVDGRHHWFVAHLVARRSWWQGPIVAVMNAEFLGDWDVAPRAHPGDGLLDVVSVAAGMSLADRLRARRRLPAGAHVPHPAITIERRPAVQLGFDRPTPVWLDGVLVGEARNLSVRLEADALTCVV